MAQVMDEILNRLGLKYEDLRETERETLHSWVQALDSNQLTLDDVKQFVRNLRTSVEQELEKRREEPRQWFDFLALLIPIYGILRKWYQDQDKLYMEARLRNLMLLEALLSTPERAKASLDRAVASIAESRKMP